MLVARPVLVRIAYYHGAGLNVQEIGVEYRSVQKVGLEGRRSSAPRTRRLLGRNLRCSYPPPRSWRRQERIKGSGHTFLFLFSLSFSLVRVIFSLGQAWAGQKGGAGNEPPCADCGRETWVKCTHDLYRSHASMNKQKKKVGLERRDFRKVGLERLDVSSGASQHLEFKNALETTRP